MGKLKISRFEKYFKNKKKTILPSQDLPTYPGSKLNVIVEYLEPIIYNKTFKTFNENVPVHLTLINETTDALNSSTMLRVMSRDTHVEDIFINVTAAKDILTENETYFDKMTVVALMAARLR